MVTKAKILGLMMVGLLSASPMIVYADNAPGKDLHQMGDWSHRPQAHLPSIAKVLNLTDDQVKQMDAIHEKDKADMKAIFEQIRANRDAFDAQIVLATPDMSKINDIQTQFKTIQAQDLDNHLNSLLSIKKILTPEQFTGFMALKKEREMMKHHGPKGGFDGQREKQGCDNTGKDDKGVGAQITEDQD